MKISLNLWNLRSCVSPPHTPREHDYAELRLFKEHCCPFAAVPGLCLIMDPQHRSNHKAVWAVPVDPAMPGAHLEAFHNAKPRMETFQLCCRFGQGESRLLRLLRKTPQEIIDVMLYRGIHLSRSRYYPEWLDDLSCVEGHCDGVNHGRYLCLRSEYGDLAAFEYLRNVRYAGLLASRKRSHMLLEAERRVQEEPTASGGKRFIDLLRNSDAKAAEASTSSHGAESSRVRQWEKSPGSLVRKAPCLAKQSQKRSRSCSSRKLCWKTLASLSPLLLRREQPGSRFILGVMQIPSNPIATAWLYVADEATAEKILPKDFIEYSMFYVIRDDAGKFPPYVERRFMKAMRWLALKSSSPEGESAKPSRSTC